MRGFLLDTHVWLWYLRGADELPPGVRELIGNSLEECWLSPISIWETGILCERGKLRFEQPFREWTESVQRKLPLRSAPLTEEVALMTSDRELPHRDPADRFLAATALVYELTLITADRRLLSAESISTFSARA